MQVYGGTDNTRAHCALCPSVDLHDTRTTSTPLNQALANLKLRAKPVTCVLIDLLNRMNVKIFYHITQLKTLQLILAVPQSYIYFSRKRDGHHLILKSALFQLRKSPVLTSVNWCNVVLSDDVSINNITFSKKETTSFFMTLQ